MPAVDRAEIGYVLPLRWSDDAHLDDLTAYLTWLSARAHVVVVDGSPAPLFERHALAWAGLVEHCAPDPPRPTANGKVGGVLTGMMRTSAARVVIADDDVRYDDVTLRRVVELLDVAQLVGPQNVFSTMPWHARWDTARSLLNRALGADYPGTFAVDGHLLRAIGGYDGDVLFENLELMRTVEAHGGRVLRPLDIYVTRSPPTARHFWSQRVRQAYDDLAQPGRLAAELLVAPGLAVAIARRRGDAVVIAAVASVVLAAAGRCRAGGTSHFPASAALFAPLWLVERGVCVWAAVACWLRGGVPYAGARLRTAANSPRELRSRVVLSRARGLRQTPGT